MAEREYIERGAALRHLLNDCVAKYPCSFYVGLSAAADEIKQLPAADVVEVVRCKDCAYANENGTTCHYGVGHYTSPMRYCSEGERKDGADNEVD